MNNSEFVLIDENELNEYHIINSSKENLFEQLSIGDKTIINYKLSEIFKIRTEPNYSYLFTYCYDYSDYISGISFDEVHKQFYIDINRISLQLFEKTVNINKFIKYVNSLDKELRTTFYLFCSQILYSKLIISIQQIFMNNYIVSEIDKSCDSKRTRVYIKNGIMYSFKKLRIVEIDSGHNLNTIYNFDLTFSLNLKKRKILRVLININKN